LQTIEQVALTAPPAASSVAVAALEDVATHTTPMAASIITNRPEEIPKFVGVSFIVFFFSSRDFLWRRLPAATVEAKQHPYRGVHQGNERT
jgi:hypothetical protein